jgi:cell division control protein CDC15
MKTRPSIDFDLVKAHNDKISSFDPADRQAVEKNFEVHEALGQGTTGVVCRAVRRSDGQQVALKMMRMDDEELLNIARQEFELLRTIEHPHIIEALDFFSYSMGAVMVLSYFAGQTLEESVHNMEDGYMPEDMSKRLFNALTMAVDHLHQQGIIHRDVKASNILVSNDRMDLKLVDFNTAQRVLEGGALTLTGTVDYLPPEVLLGESLCEKSDVWAVGLCLHLMLTGTLPVERRLFSSRIDFAQALCSEEVRLSNQRLQFISLPCKDVLGSCLEPHPQQRADAATLLATQWLRGNYYFY